MDYSNLKLVAMDLDGTLTQHKTKLEELNKTAIDKLAKKYDIVLTGAGSCNRVWQQLNQYQVDIIGNYGMQFSVAKNGDLVITKNYSVPINKENIANKINYLRELLSLHNYVGNTVEYHESGMITFPLLGTKADLEDKLKFDPDREKRRAIFNIVKEIFNDYTVFIGGTSSFDIVPPPYNKLYALNEYAQNHGYKHENIIYIGDDYGIGGNDEQIYQSDIEFICIDDYTEFNNKIKHLL